MLNDWRARSPRSPEPLIEMARLQKEAGNSPLAIQYLADALAVDGTNARALKAMGQLREEAGQYQLALENYVRSYQSNNMQRDVAERIAALQGRVAGVPPTPPRVGQTRVGEAWQYVPR
jgi:tetratricopeptide (TPR) repeat protein